MALPFSTIRIYLENWKYFFLRLRGFYSDLWTDGTQSFKSHLNFQAHGKVSVRSFLLSSFFMKMKKRRFSLFECIIGCVQWQGKLTCLQAFKMLQWLSKMWKLFLNRKATLISYLEFHYCINKCHQQSTYFIVKWNTKSINCKLRCHLDENCTKAQI